MKKCLIASLLITLTCALWANDFRSPLQFDMGAGASLAIFDTDDLKSESQDYADAEAFFLSVLSLRGGVNGTVRYYVTDHISLGAEAGIYYLSISNGNTGYDYLYLDVPLRAVVRVGRENTFIQGFAGYYLGLTEPFFGGTEVGAKLSLAGLYFSAAYTMGEYDFMRYEVGYCLNNLLN
ncbi:MAG: hypothetical protein PQJ60_08490 [Spirochaetales bacterium]|nr:hypothetical protein [Spirochaetales bacterium]